MHQRRVATHIQTLVYRYISDICIIYWDKSFLDAGLSGRLAFVYPASPVTVGAVLCMVLHAPAGIVTRAWTRVALRHAPPQGNLQSPSPPGAGTSGTTASDGKRGTAALMQHHCGYLPPHGLHRAFRCLRGVVRGPNAFVSDMKMPRACTLGISCELFGINMSTSRGAGRAESLSWGNCVPCAHAPTLWKRRGNVGNTPPMQPSLQEEGLSSHFTLDKIVLISSCQSGWYALCSHPCSLPDNEPVPFVSLLPFTGKSMSLFFLPKPTRVLRASAVFSPIAPSLKPC